MSLFFGANELNRRTRAYNVRYYYGKKLVIYLYAKIKSGPGGPCTHSRFVDRVYVCG